jgi:hypothetical protein
MAFKRNFKLQGDNNEESINYQKQPIKVVVPPIGVIGFFCHLDAWRSRQSPRNNLLRRVPA